MLNYKLSELEIATFLYFSCTHNKEAIFNQLYTLQLNAGRKPKFNLQK